MLTSLRRGVMHCRGAESLRIAADVIDEVLADGEFLERISPLALELDRDQDVVGVQPSSD
jgi:hypothetical protein